MNALEASGVSKSYGDRQVLKDFALEMMPGEFVALMGPSGSGKSTFLHLAAGLLSADSGRILVGGKDVSAMGDGAAARFRRRHVGVVFQAFNLLDSATVAENIALPAKLDRVRPDRDRLADLSVKLGLSGKEGNYPQELSGGERQRVAIARALYSRPEIVLADEPTGNLDTRSARSICDLLRELNGAEKSSILVVTHDPVVAAAATRVCFLKDGAIAASRPTDGDPEAVSRLYLEICR
ncbi:MAG: ABC transporter ATP-binding protein [Kiritimatiellae bacterium]|nr:ABC transporter ATP-binding protein [Kiritimatiellia bacterium]